MSFGLVLLNILSLSLLTAIIGISFFKWKAPGAIHFGVLVGFTLVWSLGSLFEHNSTAFGAKVFWRDFTQIGAFFLPVATVVFALAHTGTARRTVRLVAAVLGGWQAIPVLLIWTNGIHHLMRVSVSIGSGATGLPVLIVKQTLLGMAFVSINYAMMSAGVLILLVSAIRRPATRASLLIVALGLAIPSVFTCLTNIFGPLVFGGMPASASFAAGGIVALIGIQYFGFLKLSPIARDRAFEVIDEGILVSDADGRVVDMNRAARAMLSRSYPLPSEALAAEFGRRLSETLKAGIPELCARRESRFSLNLNGTDEEVHYVLRSYELLNDDRLIGYTSVLQDVSDDTHRMNRLLERAERDPMTGVYNKRAFAEILISLLEGNPPADGFLMIFDIDHFKRLNDEHGHLSGDAVIKELCRRCRECLRGEDIFGRVGGDEFALFLAGRDSESVSELAEGIRRCISSRPFALVKGQASMTISVGVAATSGKGPREGAAHSYEELFERADAALYLAKAAGRDCVRVSAG